MILSIKAPIDLKRKNFYPSIQFELNDSALNSSNCKTSAEDQKLRDLPMKFFVLKLTKDSQLPNAYFGLMKLTITHSTNQLPFFFEQYLI